MKFYKRKRFKKPISFKDAFDGEIQLGQFLSDYVYKYRDAIRLQILRERNGFYGKDN